MKTIKPFGPSICRSKISSKFIRVINNEFDSKINSSMKDYSSKLASQIKNEVKLNEQEKKVFDFMKKNKKVEIGELKDFTELSNKKWDKTIKSLTKNKLLKVFKNDSGIFVELN